MRQSGVVGSGIALLICVVAFMQAQPALADVSLGDKVVVPVDKTVNDAVSLGEDVVVYGTVRGDAVSIGGSVIIEPGGKVTGDAVSIGGDLELKHGTSVGGDVVSIFGRLIKDYNVDIGGETVSLFSGKNHGSFNDERRHGYGNKLMKLFVMGPVAGMFGVFGIVIVMILSLMKLLFMIAIAAAVTHFSPDHVVKMADTCKYSFGKNLLLGFLFVLLIPLLVLSLIITIIGIPLVPVLLVFLFLVNLYGTVGVSLWAGRLLPNDSGRSLMANVVLGILVIWLVKFIPIVNIVVKIGTGLLAFGAVIMAHFAGRRIA